MHEFDAAHDIASGPKGLEVEHRPGATFDGPMILLDDVVELLDLPDGDPVSRTGGDVIDGGLVGAIFLCHGPIAR